MATVPQARYVPNPAYGGRKERDGFVCGNPTGKHSTGLWCVVVKVGPDGVGVRDTKDLADATLSFSREEWGAFVEAVKAGEFDV